MEYGGAKTPAVSSYQNYFKYFLSLLSSYLQPIKFVCVIKSSSCLESEFRTFLTFWSLTLHSISCRIILIETYEIAKNGLAMANKVFGHLLNLDFSILFQKNRRSICRFDCKIICLVTMYKLWFNIIEYLLLIPELLLGELYLVQSKVTCPRRSNSYNTKNADEQIQIAPLPYW